VCAGGFTLLELVLVMVIICTLLGAAAPSLRGFFVSRRTDDAAARIVALTRLARSQAVAEGRIYRLAFDGRQRSCFLEAQRGGGFERLRSSLGRAFRLPDDIQVDMQLAGAVPGQDYVEFFPDGTAEPALIRLTDIKGDVVEVSCPAPTELFSISRPEDEL
jgi:type II secretion system protein H